jgi:6-phosphogluconolactonase (cycloisomerase 2 family)
VKAARLHHLFFVCFVFALCLISAGCGSVGGSSTASAGPNPSPTPNGPAPTPTPNGPTPTPTPTPVQPSGTFLYVASNGSQRQVGGQVEGFRVNADGSLSPVPGSPFKTANGSVVVKSDPQGHFVFIGEDGTVTGAPGGSNCLAHPSILLVKRVDPVSGTLTQVQSVTLKGACIRDIAVDPTGTQLYAGTDDAPGFTGLIEGFAISATGTLTKMASSPVAVDGLPLSMAMHPSGKFIYAATPNVTVLDRDTATGNLTVRGVFNTAKRQIALNAAGNWLAGAERDSDNVSEFFVDDGGNIMATDNLHPATVPDGIGVDPQGQFFVVSEFVSSANTGGLLTLEQTNPPNGEYFNTAAPPIAGGRGPQSVVFDPTGKFVYAAFANDDIVAGFVLDRTIGKLIGTAARPVETGDNPDSIVMVKPQ